ncbi:sacsin like HSP90 chaperone domain [Cryptosporidium canis]|uniref:Sacsin like HSP90 chaperone domain n=1 Tax=Cryptosporidium canis TaxID=195482 RepID=A0ABQ8P2V7_9CRYT|nr:sacsin like HSP90 chaperone domain [Cryptosporidium canis]
MLAQISHSHDYEPLSVSSRFSSVAEETAYSIAQWLVLFVNTYDSRKKVGALYRQIPNKNAASILLVNKSVEKTGQLMDLYSLLLDPLKGSAGLNSIINIDLYELLILSSSQRLLLLSKHAPTSDSLSNTSSRDFSRMRDREYSSERSLDCMIKEYIDKNPLFLGNTSNEKPTQQ